ncbi:hypothetical protein Gotri_012215 [Gossypium trilobum]|uniref:Uncharacterized protein n=1 Tax=Gossypium trilobum TaxID=34281 RepID=A0A7J9DPI9_9ROSI|nr:hypothetical protein [Gossypium trilobum]
MGLLKMVLTSSLNRMIFLLNYTCQAICEESGEEIICQSPKVTHITCRHIFEDTCSLSILLPLAISCITLVKMMICLILFIMVSNLQCDYKTCRNQEHYGHATFSLFHLSDPAITKARYNAIRLDRPSNANIATLFKQLDEDVAYIDK